MLLSLVWSRMVGLRKCARVGRVLSSGTRRDIVCGQCATFIYDLYLWHGDEFALHR